MNGLSNLGQKWNKTYRLRQKLNLKSRIANRNFYTCSSGKIKHGHETSQSASLRVSLSRYI